MPLSAALERRADDIRRFNYVAQPAEILIGKRILCRQARFFNKLLGIVSGRQWIWSRSLFKRTAVPIVTRFNRQIFELGESIQEGHFYTPCWAVSLLAQNNFGDAF
jgi:hypothetical protein